MPDFDTSLNDRIESAFASSPYLDTRKLRFEEQDGHVIIRGVVNTYFQKQMAQETVRHIKGVEKIENDLEVSWS